MAMITFRRSNHKLLIYIAKNESNRARFFFCKSTHFKFCYSIAHRIITNSGQHAFMSANLRGNAVNRAR